MLVLLAKKGGGLERWYKVLSDPVRPNVVPE